MKKLLNTLYVTKQNVYLSLKGETIALLEDDKTVLQLPLHNLESIVCFGYKGISPMLMGRCVEMGIHISFVSRSGRYLAGVAGETNGSVLVRREQYRISCEEGLRLGIARNIICAKLYNSYHFIDRTCREHPLQVDTERLREASTGIKDLLSTAKQCEDAASLRGIEGAAAERYFSVLNESVLQNKEDFCFGGRSRRPPLDRTNALLSFVYTLLASEYRSAISSAGLDPFVGFLHADRSGRASLALDLMEELRSVVADRFVISVINNRVIKPNMFTVRENGAVYLDDDGRRALIAAWQERKQKTITHPFLDEKIEWGLVPYSQALLLSRYIRGDLDAYPPFFWRQ